MVLQLGQTPRRVLSPVHANESAASRRDQINAHDIAKLPESVRQVFLMNQLRQMPHPQRRTANYQKKLTTFAKSYNRRLTAEVVFFDRWQSSFSSFPVLFTFLFFFPFAFPIPFSVSGRAGSPSARPRSWSRSGSTPSVASVAWSAPRSTATSSTIPVFRRETLWIRMFQINNLRVQKSSFQKNCHVFYFSFLQKVCVIRLHVPY